MSFSHDRRGQSVVVGTVILFGFLILALSLYQVQFVPAENSEVEFEHSQQVEGDFLDLRNALLSGGTTGEARSTSIRLGTRYPQRTFFLNPPPASGTLETTEERPFEVDAAIGDGAHENVAAFWNTTPQFNTSSIRYTPNYNEHQGAPRLVYENSLVAAEFGDRALPRSDQTIVRDERVSLTTISGDISENGVEARSVDSETVSRGTRTIPITGNGEGENVTISLPTAVSNATDLVERLDRNDFTADGDRIVITLNGNNTYRLALSEVSVAGGGETEPAYIVPVGGQNVTSGQSVGVEVRDKYNNPVEGTEVVISDQNNRTTGDDGRVFFNPGSDDSIASINGSFDPNKPGYESVEFDVSPAGSGGETNRTYSVTWNEPEGPLSAGHEVSGTVRGDGELLDNATVDFATANPSIVTFQGRNTNTTTVDGEFTTTVSTGSEGTATLFASSGDGVDQIEVEVDSTYEILSVAPSPGGGNDIDVEFEIDTSDPNAQVNVQSLTADGSVRDETGLIPVESTQPQTETIGGANQATEIRVILFDSDGNEEDRETVPYP